MSWGRWHPSLSTPEERERIRELAPDLYPAMFELDEAALFQLIDDVERLDPLDRRLGALNLILVRRLEGA